MANCLLFG